jgi:hypothetical protein
MAGNKAISDSSTLWLVLIAALWFAFFVSTGIVLFTDSFAQPRHDPPVFLQPSKHTTELPHTPKIALFMGILFAFVLLNELLGTLFSGGIFRHAEHTA